MTSGRKKINIILDLDQTLISAETYTKRFKKENKEQLKNFNFFKMEEYYYVIERPGLQEFLDFLFKNFNVSIWTAASKDYALSIIQYIILKESGRKLDYVFFSYHCGISKKEKGTPKKLSIFWKKYGMKGYDKHNTIIIDDLKEIYESQKRNCIKAKPFYFKKKKSEQDEFLKKLQSCLQENIDNDKLSSKQIIQNVESCIKN